MVVRFTALPLYRRLVIVGGAVLLCLAFGLLVAGQLQRDVQAPATLTVPLTVASALLVVTGVLIGILTQGRAAAGQRMGHRRNLAYHRAVLRRVPVLPRHLLMALCWCAALLWFVVLTGNAGVPEQHGDRFILNDHGRITELTPAQYRAATVAGQGRQTVWTIMACSTVILLTWGASSEPFVED